MYNIKNKNSLPNICLNFKMLILRIIVKDVISVLFILCCFLQRPINRDPVYKVIITSNIWIIYRPHPPPIGGGLGAPAPPL